MHAAAKKYKASDDRAVQLHNEYKAHKATGNSTIIADSDNTGPGYLKDTREWQAAAADQAKEISDMTATWVGLQSPLLF